ncbi:MAG: FecR family protein [Marinagarivorans sp.]|nr:FecR family protein [Marinagarivorans sp.]
MFKDDDDVAHLLKAAGKRSEPAPEVSDKIWQSTHAAWLQAVQAAKFKNENNADNSAANKSNNLSQLGSTSITSTTKPWGQVWFAVAAAVLVGFMAFIMVPKLNLLGDNTTVVAQLIMTNGAVNIKPSLHEQVINAGAHLTTQNDGLVAIQLTDNTKITLAKNTEIIVANAGLIRLVQGRIYVDSPDANTSIIVATPLGEIVDIGTQYEVNVTPTSLGVAMREGVTKITLAGKTLYGRVADGLGDAITVDTHLNVTKDKIATADDYWLWTQPAVADFNLHNATAHDLLHWASRVTGKKIIYASPQVQRTAEQTHLSGGYLAAQSISQVLPVLFKTTSLQVVEQREALVVSE